MAKPVVVTFRGVAFLMCPSAPPPFIVSFRTTNPAWVPYGPNVYAYVKQNPWTSFDPHGLQAWGELGSDVVGTIGGAVSGAYGLVAHGLGAAAETMSGGMLYSGCNEKFNTGVVAVGKDMFHKVDQTAHAAMSAAQGRWGEAGGHVQNVLGDTPGKMIGNLLTIGLAEGAFSKMKGGKGAPVAEVSGGSPEASAKPNAASKPLTDYSHIKDPKNVNANTKPTPRQVREMKKANRAQNGGGLRDDVSGEPGAGTTHEIL